MAQLTACDLALGYDGQALIEHLNFEVNTGDYLVIVGENGSGKTTLMKTILGLVPPLSGEIKTGDGLRHTEIGYLPQQTVVQRDFPASVREIVLSGCQARVGLRPFYRREEKALAAEAMARLGVDIFADKCYRDLSGGQQQRVLLARALCATRKLLLLDEPVSGLDPNVTAEMYALIDELNKKDGITVIMISHDLDSAMKYASHILHIAGNGVFFGTRDDYLASEERGIFLALESRRLERKKIRNTDQAGAYRSQPRRHYGEGHSVRPSSTEEPIGAQRTQAGKADAATGADVSENVTSEADRGFTSADMRESEADGSLTMPEERNSAAGSGAGEEKDHA